MAGNGRDCHDQEITDSENKTYVIVDVGGWQSNLRQKIILARLNILHHVEYIRGNNVEMS